MTKSERSEIARQLQSLRKTKRGGKNGGRPRSCECGACHNCKRWLKRHPTQQ